MNPHRQNHRPERPVGFGWAVCALLGVAIAVCTLLAQCVAAL